jgi:hypothetical protein
MVSVLLLVRAGDADRFYSMLWGNSHTPNGQVWGLVPVNVVQRTLSADTVTRLHCAVLVQEHVTSLS